MKTEAVLGPALVAALKFDKYFAYVPTATVDQLADLFTDCGERLDRRESRSRKGGPFHAFRFYDDRRKEVGTVRLRKGIPTISVVGNASPVVVSRLRSMFAHELWKADVCLDSFDGDGEYNAIKRALMNVKLTDSRLSGYEIRDEDHPERGATYYLGMKDSPGCVCLYQKGRQPGFRNKGVDGWNRIEWRVKIDASQRELASTLDPINIIQLISLTRKAANEVLGTALKRVKKVPPQAKTSIQSLEWQCGKFSRRWREAGVDLGGNEKVLERIGFAMDGQRWICRPAHAYAADRSSGTDVHRLWPWLKTMVEKSRQRNAVDVDAPAVTVLSLESDDVRMEPYLLGS